jgi:hypothetical protein
MKRTAETSLRLGRRTLAALGVLLCLGVFGIIAWQADAQSKKREKPAQPAAEQDRTASAVVRDEQPDSILLNVGPIDTLSAPNRMAPEGRETFSGKEMRLVKFRGPIQSEWREALDASGVATVDYIPNYAYLVYGDANDINRLRETANRGTESGITWIGEYKAEHRIQPAAYRTTGERGAERRISSSTGYFQVQLFKDKTANDQTLARIRQIENGPAKEGYDFRHYVNLVVALSPEAVEEIADRGDVISIFPYIEPKKMDERQSMILAGNLTGNNPNTGNYFDLLTTWGFTQAQFNNSGFVVDVTDDGADRNPTGADPGTIATNANNGPVAARHFVLFESGNRPIGSTTPSGTSRFIYKGRWGSNSTTDGGLGLSGHGQLNMSIVGGYVPTGAPFDAAPHADLSGFRYGLGVAPFVKMANSVIFDPGYTNPSFPAMLSAGYASGARISTNSWGAPNGGAYTSDSQTYDGLVRDAQSGTAGNQQMIITFSAGNDGSGANTIGSPGTGKNVFTVGAAENVQPFGGADGCGTTDAEANSANDIGGFSSRGPTDDQRIKPDIQAPGTHVSGMAYVSNGSTGNGTLDAGFRNDGVCGGVQIGGAPFELFPVGQSWYTASSGTSHSNPAVAGGSALVYQQFINNPAYISTYKAPAGADPPSPAMNKAYIVNSSRYMTGVSANDTLPSNSQGFGMMNLGLAFDGTQRVIRDQFSVDTIANTGEQRVFTGTVVDATKPFRVTLAFTDAPGSTSGNSFVNNLDLEVSVGGNTYRGNVFSGANSITGGSFDPRNNIESVFIPAGIPVGTAYTVRVIGTNIPGDGVPGNADSTDQDFALVVYNADSQLIPVIVTSGQAITAESCTPANSALDPGETVTVDLTITNGGTGPTNGNVTGTLQATGGVTAPSGPQNFGALTPNGSSTQPFTFTVNPAQLCGSNVTVTLSLTDGSGSLGSMTYTFPVGVPALSLSQNFDAVTPPALPSGWTATLVGAGTAWQTQATAPDSVPNSVFAPNPATPTDNILVSPLQFANGPSQVTFRNNYNTESTFDGGVLEISINEDAWQDIIAAGGSFTAGGYNGTLSTNASFLNPLVGRNAWTGNSGGYVTTTANLPAGAEGNFFRLRWRLGTDNAISSTGWRVDSIVVSAGYNCCGTPVSPVPPFVQRDAVTITELAGATNSDSDGFFEPGERLSISIPLTNIGGSTSTAVSNTLTSTTPGVSFVQATGSYGSINAGATVTDSSFVLQLSPSFVPFTTINITSTVTYGGGPITSNVSTFSINTSCPVGAPSSTTFSNTGAITIPVSGNASPYPSAIAVSGLTGNVTKVTATLTNFSHEFPSDVDVVLVGPGGQYVILMSDAGGTVAVTNRVLTFDDAAASTVPSGAGSGTYKPTNTAGPDTFPSPGPGAITQINPVLSTFNSLNPNGTWNLYVVDDATPDGGSIAGWSITITTVPPNCSTTAVAASPTPTPTPTPNLLYTIEEIGDRLKSINTDTLAITDIGPLGVAFRFGGLAYDAAADKLYMIDGREAKGLYTVNRTTGAATLVGLHGVTDLFGLAYDSTNGILYASQSAGSNLYRLDTTTGAATLVGNMGVGIGGLAYDPETDRLIGIAEGVGDLFEIDRATAAATLVFDGSPKNSTGLEYDYDLNLYWDIDWDGNLYSYDPTAGYTRTTRLTGLGPYDGLAYVSASGPSATPTPTPTCPPTFRVLIVYSDSAGLPTGLQNQILAEPDVTGVDLFNAASGTPTLAQLQAYDIVVPYSSSNFSNSTAIGDNLADYVDGGGVVVQYGFSHVGPGDFRGVNGRWVTGSYNPYNYSSSIVHDGPFTLGTFNAGHPLMAGVTTLNSNYQNVVTATAASVATASNGNSLVAFRNVSGGHTTVGVSAYVGIDAAQSGHWGRVVVNAGRWLLGQGCPTPAATPNVTGVSPTSGPTAGGNAVTITGANLTGATAVAFGGTAATSFTVNSPTQITATAPVRASGTVSVDVTTPAGTNAPNTLYTYESETTVTVSGGNLTITDTNGGNSNDNITIACTPPNITITDPGNGVSQTVPIASVTGSITVDTLGGNDTLTVDFSGCNFVPPGGLTFNGGNGNDVLKLQGGSFNDVVSTPSSPSSGVIEYRGGTTGNANINYTGLEPIVDLVAAANLTVNGTAAGETISYTVGTAVANGLVSSATFESYEFSNKTSVTINSLGGDDTISLNNPNVPTGLTSLVVNAGAGATDTITLNGRPVQDQIRFGPTGTGAGTITGYGPLSSVAGVEILQGALNGSSDHLTVDGTIGSDNITVQSGPAAGEIHYSGSMNNGAFSLPQIDVTGASSALIGTINFNNAGGTDTLVVNGTTLADTFNMTRATATSGSIDHDTGVAAQWNFIGFANFSTITVNGLDNIDAFNLPDDFPTNVTMNGGNPVDGDSMTLTGRPGFQDQRRFNPTGEDSGIITGTGVSTKTIVSVSQVNVNFNAGDGSDHFTVDGTAGSDNIVVDSGPAAGDIRYSGVMNNGAFNLPQIDVVNSSSALIGTINFNNAGGTDTLVVNGTSVSDTFNMSRATATSGSIDHDTGANQQWNFIGFANFANITVNGGDSADKYNLNVDFPTNVTLDGGLPADGDSVVLSGRPGQQDQLRFAPTAQHSGNVTATGTSIKTLAGISVLTANLDAADNDHLTVDGTVGNDDIFVTSGPAKGELRYTGSMNNAAFALPQIDVTNASSSLIGTINFNNVGGVDKFNFSATSGADEVTFNGDNLVHKIGGNTINFVGFVNFRDLILNGLDQDDHFILKPFANGPQTRNLTVNGGNPNIFGDTLAVDEVGVTGGILAINNAGVGTYTSTSHQTINLTGFEPGGATMTTLVSSAPVSVSGQPVTFTATVTSTPPGFGIPQGLVNFLEDGNPIAGCQGVALNPSGVAQCTAGSLGVGVNKTISAVYLENLPFTTSTGTAPQTVNAASTTTGVNGLPSPSVYGQSVTFTATVTTNAPGGGVPAGTVTFRVGGINCSTGTVLGSGTLNGSGQAAVTTAVLSTGSNAIRACYGGSASHEPSSGTTSQSVNPAVLTITADNKTRVYGAANPPLTATITGFVNGETLATSGVTGLPALSTMATPASPAGNYPIVPAVGTLAAGNYSFAFANGTLTVDKAVLTVNAQAASKTYGDADPAFSATLAGFRLGDNEQNSGITGSASCTRSAGESVAGSPYAISCTPGSLSAPNYTFEAGAGAGFTIGKAVLDVDAQGASKAYGSPDPAFAFALSGFKFADTAATSGITGTASCTRTTGETVANSPYAIACTGGNLASPNYTFRQGAGASFAITKAVLAVDAQAASKTYGQGDPAAFPFALTGFKFSDTAANSGITGSPACTRNAGESVAGSPYAIACTPGTLAAPNYNFQAGTGAAFTIGKKELNVRADDKTRVYGAANPAFTYTVTGFAFAETLATSGVAGSPALATAAGPASPVGEYPITAAAGTLSAGNYTFAFANGTLTVGRSGSAVAIANAAAVSGAVSTVGQPYTVAFAVGAHPVGAGAAPTGVVTVSDGAGATCTADLTAANNGSGSCSLASTTPGDKTITASYAGDANYTASTTPAGVPHRVVIAVSGSVRQFAAGGTATPLAGVAVVLSVGGTNVSTATTDAGGNYVFGVPTSGSSITITPSSSGRVFEPLSRTYANVANNISGADFLAYDTSGGANANPREIRFVNAVAAAGQPVTVPVEVASLGNERVFAFSVGYDAALMGSPTNISCGADFAGCTVAAFDTSTPGRVGIRVSRGGAMAAGAREVVRVTFPTFANTASSTPLTFADNPVQRRTLNAEGDPVPVLYQNGFVAFGQPGGPLDLEGDVVDAAGSPAGGDGVRSNDVTVVRRMVLGLIAPDVATGQFRRADVSPADLGGDGRIDATDVTVVRMYALGALPPTPASGPAAATATRLGHDGVEDRSEEMRSIRLGQVEADGHYISVPVLIGSNGDESAASFTIEYDPALLAYESSTLGRNVPQGSVVSVASNDAGRLGVLIDSTSTFAKGDQQMLSIRFKAIGLVGREGYHIGFSSNVARLAVSSADGRLLRTEFGSR